MWVVWIGGAVLLLLTGSFAWGLVRIRRGVAQATAAARRIAPDEIPGLVAEFVAKTEAYLGTVVRLDDPEEGARTLSVLMDEPERLKPIYSRDGFWWRFALPAGAALGEYMCRHAGGRWILGEAGEPVIEIGIAGGESAITHPFAKVIEHVVSGERGEIYLYLQASLQLDRIAKAV